MKVFDEILLKHTDIQTCRESYIFNKDISIIVEQKENKVVLSAFNNATDRFVNLGTKRFERLIEGFKSVASDLYSKDYYYYIILGPTDNDDLVDEVAQLKKEIARLNDIIAGLEKSNKRLQGDVDKHNARGAGRKSRFSDAQVEEIKSLREGGHTIKEIATRFECSVGLIHKLINEQ
ncbi:helix-turn-helix domain-containing protein [Clostridium sp.]|uniref:helix-turn-helix domain-containing protein n=1 Tax=Clostridium sp. TaxID=1506 RepID=UPI003F2B74DA